jgi:hypothetical protein
MSEANEFSEAAGLPSSPKSGTLVKDEAESWSFRGTSQQFVCLYKARGLIHNERLKFEK